MFDNVTVDEHINVFERYSKGHNIIHANKTFMALYLNFNVLKGLIPRSNNHHRIHRTRNIFIVRLVFKSKKEKKMRKMIAALPWVAPVVVRGQCEQQRGPRQ